MAQEKAILVLIPETGILLELEPGTYSRGELAGMVIHLASQVKDYNRAAEELELPSYLNQEDLLPAMEASEQAAFLMAAMPEELVVKPGQKPAEGSDLTPWEALLELKHAPRLMM